MKNVKVFDEKKIVKVYASADNLIFEKVIKKVNEKLKEDYIMIDYIVKNDNNYDFIVEQVKELFDVDELLEGLKDEKLINDLINHYYKMFSKEIEKNNDGQFVRIS